MRFIGIIGFWEGDEETSPDVWKSKIVERTYICDEVSNQNRRFQQSGYRNDNLIVSSQISILSDMYAIENWSSIRYVVWNGVSWFVNNVRPGYPRITLELGGVYKNDRPNETWNDSEKNLGVE